MYSTYIYVRYCGDGERDGEIVQTKGKHAIKQVLVIKYEAIRIKVTPPLAMVPLAYQDI